MEEDYFGINGAVCYRSMRLNTMRVTAMSTLRDDSFLSPSPHYVAETCTISPSHSHYHAHEIDHVTTIGC
jgi:hypothetical protein